MAELDCEETKRNVHEYLHNELSEAEIKQLTAHLANCDSCEDEYAVEDALINVITRACDEVPSEQLAEAIRNRISDIQKGATH